MINKSKAKFCIVCGKIAIIKLWCYSGKEQLSFCSKKCFKKACKLFNRIEIKTKQFENYQNDK